MVIRHALIGILMRLLCAQPDPTYQKIIDIMLAPTGIDVFMASSVVSFVQAFEESRFDLLLIDTNVAYSAASDDFGFLRRVVQLNQEHLQGQAKILCISDARTPIVSDRALRCGADHFLAKPFTASGLLSAIDLTLATHQAQALRGLLGVFACHSA